MTQMIQCVPNFSEGRRPDVIGAIVQSVQKTPGIRLADWSADTDHNRLVVTFLGSCEAVRAAALAAARVAIETIDLREHDGVHPRLGALDVLPFVPIAGVTLDDCAALAREVGRELAEKLALPVFFYEAATDDNRALPTVRRAAFQTLPPDFGPPVPHPTAGAVVIGARGPLIAFNVNLATPQIAVARAIAREVRAGAAGSDGVRALGLRLPSRGMTQVSMNVTRPAQTSLLAVYGYIAQRAQELGTETVQSEIIGALPGFAAFDLLRDALRATGLQPGQVLWENWKDS